MVRTRPVDTSSWCAASARLAALYTWPRRAVGVVAHGPVGSYTTTFRIESSREQQNGEGEANGIVNTWRGPTRGGDKLLQAATPRASPPLPCVIIARDRSVPGDHELITHGCSLRAPLN